MALKTEMTSSALIELVQALERAGIPVWLDGGWGVDALLGQQTRPHKDLDIIVPVADVSKLQATLARRRFAVREGVPPNSLVLADGAGLEVDVHAVAFDRDGNGVHQMENGKDWTFAAEAFSGSGVVDGFRVRCLSPMAQVLCHAQGYVPAAKDLRDMDLLHERFGVDLKRALLEKHVASLRPG
jgi:lincosamide nucleotidyltransferase A/C/D/E